MSPEDIQALVDRISWGARYESVRNAKGKDVVIISKSLTLADKNWINFIYRQALKEGEKNGLLKESDLFVHYNSSGIWTKAHDRKIEDLKEDIKKLQNGLKEKNLTSREKKITGAMIKGANLALEKLVQERLDKFGMSLERYAEDRKIYAIVYCTTYNLDNTKFWSSWADFEDEIDSVFIKNIIDRLFSFSPANTKQIREIARSPLWRFKWAASQKADDLFGKPIVELNNEQEALVYWSQVYDAAYEAYERPPDYIIEDDDALDKWFEDQSKKRKAEQVAAGKQKAKYGVGEDVARHSEVMIVANKNINPEAPEMSEIWDLNSDGTKKFIKIQREKLKKSGPRLVKEQEMRADRASRMISGAKRAEFEIRGGKKQVNKLYDY